MLTLRSIHLNFIRASLAILLLAMVCQSCGEERQCACPIKRPTTAESGNSLDSTNQTYSIDGGLELNIPNIKKLIEADIDLSGNFRNSDIQVQKTYWEILGGNPQVTQHANLFWTTACAMYEIACEDITINEEEKEAEKRQIVKEYDAKIGKIIEETLLRTATTTSTTTTTKESPQTPSVQKKETTTRAERNAPKYIQVKLIVDAIFSDADFFLNGGAINPLPSSTLTVKDFEINQEGDDVTFMAKAGNQECKKSFRIPSNYFDNPYTIQLTCSK